MAAAATAHLKAQDKLESLHLEIERGTGNDECAKQSLLIR